jgi:hypothetical protein
MIVVATEVGRALKLSNHRPQRAVLAVGRAVVARMDMRLVGQPISHGLDQARLADAGLAREQHHLALTLLGLLPAIEQQSELLSATD